MTQLSLILPEIGSPSKTEDPKTDNAFTAIQTWANGNIDSTNLKERGVSEIALAGMTSSIISATETRENLSFGKMPTADEVPVTVPTNGVIEVLFLAQWRAVNSGFAYAGLFLDGTQVKLAAPANTFEAVEVAIGASTEFSHLSTGTYQLFSEANVGIAATDLASGQVIGQALSAAGASTRHGPAGGALLMYASAGPHVVSVQYKTQAGVKCEVRNRKLWARAR